MYAGISSETGETGSSDAPTPPPPPQHQRSMLARQLPQYSTMKTGLALPTTLQRSTPEDFVGCLSRLQFCAVV